MYAFVGANGPCKVSVNVGGKIFRTHHDEISKGLVSGGTMDFKDLKKNVPTIPL